MEKISPTVENAMQTIKLNFADFWPSFDKSNNFFCRLLSKHYAIEISDRPDFLIYSCYGREFRKYDCLRIYYTGENYRPDFSDCDFAFSFDFLDDPRHYRLPVYALYGGVRQLTAPRADPWDILAEKRGFCSMVVSNPGCEKRNRFFHKLSQYKQVASGGRFLNNVDGPVKDKLGFLRQHKFTLAFENSSHPGYTTEKLAQGMRANALPIYWGNPLVHKDFNTKSFINLHEFDSEDDAIGKIIEADTNDQVCAQYLSQPFFENNNPGECVKEENILRQFEMIFSSKGKIRPVARGLKKYIALFSKLSRRLRG